MFSYLEENAIDELWRLKLEQDEHGLPLLTCSPETGPEIIRISGKRRIEIDAQCNGPQLSGPHQHWRMGRVHLFAAYGS